MVLSCITGDYYSMNKGNWEKFWGILQVSYKPLQTCSPSTEHNLEPDSVKVYSDHVVVMCIINTNF